MGQLVERVEDGVTIYENPESGEELGATQVESDDLQKKTKAELLELAKANDVKVSDSATKDEIITLLTAQ